MSTKDETIAKVFYEEYPEYRKVFVRSRAALPVPEITEELGKEVPEHVPTKFD